MNKPMTLRDKILSGYKYQIKSPNTIKDGERKVDLFTGKGGVLLYIDACEAAGIPEALIAPTIICYTNMGPYTMDVLNVKPTDETSAA